MVPKAPFFCRYWYDHQYRQYYWHLKRLLRAIREYPEKMNPEFLKVTTKNYFNIFMDKNLNLYREE